MSTNTKAAEMLEQVNSAISAVLASQSRAPVIKARQPIPDAGGPGPAESHS